MDQKEYYAKVATAVTIFITALGTIINVGIAALLNYFFSTGFGRNLCFIIIVELIIALFLLVKMVINLEGDALNS